MKKSLPFFLLFTLAFICFNSQAKMVEIDCPKCHNIYSKKIINHHAQPDFGSGNDIIYTCENCGETYSMYESHFCLCSECGGTGHKFIEVEEEIIPKQTEVPDQQNYGIVPHNILPSYSTPANNSNNNYSNRNSNHSTSNFKNHQDDEYEIYSEQLERTVSNYIDIRSTIIVFFLISILLIPPVVKYRKKIKPYLMSKIIYSQQVIKDANNPEHPNKLYSELAQNLGQMFVSFFNAVLSSVLLIYIISYKLVKFLISLLKKGKDIANKKYDEHVHSPKKSDTPQTLQAVYYGPHPSEQNMQNTQHPKIVHNPSSLPPTLTQHTIEVEINQAQQTTPQIYKYAENQQTPPPFKDTENQQTPPPFKDTEKKNKYLT